MQIAADTAQWAIDEARASLLPHNAARAVFADIVTYVLTERAVARIGRGWLTRENREAWEKVRADLQTELDENEQFRRRFRRPLAGCDAAGLLGRSLHLGRPAARRRRRSGATSPDGMAWTVSDVPLLDELIDLLGPTSLPTIPPSGSNKPKHVMRQVFWRIWSPAKT